MAARIYKKGQGYWTRMMTAIGGGLLTLMGAAWLWNTLGGVRLGSLQTIYLQAGAATLLVAVLGALCYYFVGCHRKVVDFLIATEGEMKKVNWSTRREILGSTWVVIGLTFVIALIIAVLDLTYHWIFAWMNVLETPG